MSPEVSEFRAVLRLAVPVIASYFGMMLLGVVDTMMMGHESKHGLAAVGLGNTFYFWVSHFSLGVLTALDPLISQAIGARDERSVGRNLKRGIVLATALSVPTILILWPAEAIFGFLGQEPGLVPDAAAYVRVVATSAPAYLLFLVFRSTLQGLHTIRPIVIVIVAGNVLNVGLNWALIFGHLGFERMGGIGCGISTVVCKWAMLAGLLWLVKDPLRPYLRGSFRRGFDLRPQLHILRIGMPTGLANLIESGAFAAVVVMMGWFGELEIAAHQVTLNYAALSFMVPLGMSTAAAVRVGRGVGQADPERVRTTARASLGIGLGFMLFSGLLFVSVPGFLSKQFTNEADVTALAATLLPIAGAFQLFDGLQVVASGILRGMADTFVPMLLCLIFFAFGIVMSWLLGHHLGLGPTGLWWGLVIGLGTVGIVLLVRVRLLLARVPSRVDVDVDAPRRAVTPCQ